MNKEEMKSIRKIMAWHERNLEDALESSRQIRMEVEKMEKEYSETEADLQAAMTIDQMVRKNAEAGRMLKEMTEKPIHFPTDDKPMTAEEREERHRMIPTRIATKTGTWEIIGDYKGDKTQVGFLAKKEHKYGPLDNCADRIVLTVEEWCSMNDELEKALILMVL